MNAADAVLAQVKAALAAWPGLTVVLIEEDLDADAFPEDLEEAISLSLVDSQPQQVGPINGHPVDWLSTLVVECYARRDSAVQGGARASRALHARAYAALMANRALGGVADDIRQPQIVTEGIRRNTRMGCTTGTYPVAHRTQANTLEAP